MGEAELFSLLTTTLFSEGNTIKKFTLFAAMLAALFATSAASAQEMQSVLDGPPPAPITTEQTIIELHASVNDDDALLSLGVTTPLLSGAGYEVLFFPDGFMTGGRLMIGQPVEADLWHWHHGLVKQVGNTNPKKWASEVGSLIGKVNKKVRDTGKKDTKGNPIYKTEDQLTDADKGNMINFHDKEWGYYLKVSEHRKLHSRGPKKDLITVQKVWEIWKTEWLKKNKECDITKADFTAVYAAIKGDNPGGIGITPAVLTAGGVKWPPGRFGNIYATGCPACYNYKNGAGGECSYLLDETPHWTSGIDKQAHAQKVHDDDCECPKKEGGDPDVKEEETEEIK